MQIFLTILLVIIIIMFVAFIPWFAGKCFHSSYDGDIIEEWWMGFGLITVSAGVIIVITYLYQLASEIIKGIYL